MAGIKKETWREQKISLVSGVVKEVFFTDTKPTVIQVVNMSGSQNLYVYTKANVSDTSFELSIIPEASKLLVKPQGVSYIYLFTLDNVDVLVNSGEGEIYPSDLNQEADVIIKSNVATNLEITKINQPLPSGTNHLGEVSISNSNINVTTQSQVEVMNDTGNPLPVVTVDTGFKAQKVTLTSGVDYTVKASGGYIANIVTSLTDLLVKNNGVEVWKNGYSGKEFFNDTNIVLSSVAGGDVYIVWK